MTFIRIRPFSTVHIVEGKGTLRDFYEWIDCGIVEVACRKIGKTEYCIICDEEGLLKENPICTAVDYKGNPSLVGTLIVGVEDPEAVKCAVGLNENQINEILQNVRYSLQERTIDDEAELSPVLICS